MVRAVYRTCYTASVILESEGAAGFAERIKQLRARAGLTQARLAALLGVSVASVNRWEQGRARPSALARRLIVRAEAEGIGVLGGPREPARGAGRGTAGAPIRPAGEARAASD